MAKRIKSAIKRAKIAERNRLRNVSVKSAIKTYIKKVENDLASNKMEDLEKDLKEAIKRLDKAASKGILHKNTVARKKSRLMKKVNKAKASLSS
ncbi:MAG: 30S ribosomal protein S20 [Candidatus Sericytochromatia bacterium]|nr:MAG: 30S ribosomal protein S20 [Candidatus Sericytochromatia bacterium]